MLENCGTNDTIYYVVRVGGKEVSTRYSNRVLAEQELINLAPEQKQLAEIVPVTADGKQVLLG